MMNERMHTPKCDYCGRFVGVVFTGGAGVLSSFSAAWLRTLQRHYHQKCKEEAEFANRLYEGAFR
jgi:hypothetical protein